MALITDPDLLNQGTEVVFDTNARTIKLNQAGNLTTDGVTLQCLYSFAKEEWLNDAALAPHPFPMLAITREQFEVGNNGTQYSGWTWADDATRLLVRTAGWAEYDSSGSKTREYAGIITLGGPEADDQPYYELTPGVPVNFSRTGPVNEAVQIFGDANNGNFDKRTYFKVYVREYAQLYNQSSIGDIGVSSMENIVYRFPLATGADTKIVADDATVASSAPYTSMSISYYNTPQSRTIGGTAYDFHVIIDGAGATAEEIYTFVQHQLRQSGNIDATNTFTIVGQVASPLLKFVGDSLYTQYVDESSQASGVVGGTYIDNYNSNDVNRIYFTDDTQAVRNEPFVAAGSIVFNANLQNDPNAKYWMYFEYTKRYSGSDIAVTATSGNTATITSTTTDLSNIKSGDQFIVSGFTTAGNNGKWEATANATATSVTAQKVDGGAPADEAAGATVTITEHAYGTSSAVIVQDKNGTDIAGAVGGAASVSFTFDYDGNSQGGRAPSTDAPVVVAAIGLNTAQFVSGKFTITKATGLSFPLNANLERNYSNPV